jgi:hypothetical protein
VKGLGLVNSEVISDEEVGEVYRKVDRKMSGQRRYVSYLANKWTEYCKYHLALDVEKLKGRTHTNFVKE